MPHPNFIAQPSPGARSVGGPSSFTTDDGANAYFPERNYAITGVTRNASGAALGGCTVMLYRTDQMTMIQMTTSDASGNFSFVVDKTLTWYCTAYLAGSPDVTGATLNTLAGA